MTQKINLLKSKDIEVKCYLCEHTHFIQAKHLKRKVIKCLCGSKITIENGIIVKFKHAAVKIPLHMQIEKATTELHNAIWDLEMRLRRNIPLAVMFYTGIFGLFILSFIEALLN